MILSSTGIDHKTKASSLIRSTKFANASGKVKLVAVFFSAEFYIYKLFKCQVIVYKHQSSALSVVQLYLRLSDVLIFTD